MDSNAVRSKLELEVDAVGAALGIAPSDLLPVESAESLEAPVQHLTPSQLNELILEHTDYGQRLARSFLNRWRVRMNQAEVTSVVGMALCEAANRFDVSRGVSFKTFLFYHLRGLLIKEIIRLIEDQRSSKIVAQLESGETAPPDLSSAEGWPLPVYETKTPEKLLQRQQIAKACWQACSELDDLEKDVVLRFFVYDEPLNQIAEELGYCRCHISRVKSRALATLSRRLVQLVPDFGREMLQMAESAEKAKNQSANVGRNYTGGRGRRRGLQTSGSAEVMMSFLKKAS